MTRELIDEVLRGTRPPSDLARHYDNDYYKGGGTPRPYGKPEEHHAPRNRVILQQAGVRPDAAILEAGCGRGQVVHMLVNEFGCHNITGCDFSRTAIVWCEAAYPKQRFHCCDVSRTPYPDGAFDIILALDVTEHLLHYIYHAALAEWFRLTKRGGVVAVLPGGGEGFPEHINVLAPAVVLDDLNSVGFICEMRETLGDPWILARRPET